MTNFDKFKMYDYSKGYRDQGCYIPERMMEPIQRYIDFGEMPGDFLQKVICNDLFGAIAHADIENQVNLPAYARFFYNNTPSDCFGSMEKMKAWSEKQKQDK